MFHWIVWFLVMSKSKFTICKVWEKKDTGNVSTISNKNVTKFNLY